MPNDKIGTNRIIIGTAQNKHNYGYEYVIRSGFIRRIYNIYGGLMSQIKSTYCVNTYNACVY